MRQSFREPVRVVVLLTREQVAYLDKLADQRAASRAQVVRDIVREDMERDLAQAVSQ